MPIDTSMYNTTAPQPINPLQTMTTIAGIQNMQQQNKLMGQMYGFNQQQNPQLLQAQDLQNKAHQIDLAVKGQTNLVNGLTPLVQQIIDSKGGKAKPITPGDVAIKAKELLDAGVIDPKTYATEMANMPNQPGDELNNWALQHYQTGQEGLAHIQALQGQLVQTNTGGSVVQQRNSVFGGPLTPAGSLQMSPSPEFLATPHTFTDASGTPQQTTIGQYDRTIGAGGGAASLGGAPSMPQGSAAAPQNPLAAATGTPPPQGRPAMRGAIAGPAPGVVEAAAHSGAASADSLARDSEASKTYAQDSTTLSKALYAVQHSPTGPSTDATNNIKSFLLAQGVPGVDADTVMNHDEAVKYMAGWAAAQPGMGATDQGRAMAQVSNASTHISNKAAQQVLKTAMEVRNMKQAATAAFQQSGAPSQNYNAFITDFASHADPRAFAFDKLDPAEKAQVIKSLKTQAARDKFSHSYNLAVQSGVVTHGGADGQ